ncbi:cell division cycle-associated protein 4-like [Eubalaena glacialis]|uniref:cell division cycle-associated protein 4-like n=1 Tax=Eubalaena glacialis TaxID=27606 RepID=UPI002A59C618|nr:cell division cycle-associated protein 4-like [Eubalaena glacialis]
MFARGLKRKRTEDEEAAPAYSLQRQSLLDMSLVKLQLCHMLVEPNLCRSVLVTNTDLQIQEMTQDGRWCVPVPQTTGRASRDLLVSTEILCCCAWEGVHPAPDPGDLASEFQVVPVVQAPGGSPGGVWGRHGPRENRGSFHKSLDQIFETLESQSPGAVEELFSDVDGSYYDLDAVLTGMLGGVKLSQDGLDHVVDILVET